MSEKSLTPDALAERWSVPKSQVYRLAREGRIPVVRLGKYMRFRLDQIEAWEIGEPWSSSANGTSVDMKQEAA